jgi:hypothetical protein
MTNEVSDEHERPTLVSPQRFLLPHPPARPASTLGFDGDSERFFLAGDGAFDGTATLDAPSEQEDVWEWWGAQRRKTLAPYVAALVAVCVLLLAAGAFPQK